MPQRAAHTVESPAGETIRLIPDEQWAKQAGRTVGEVRRPYRTKLAVIRALWEHGPAENTSGQASQVLHQRAVLYGYSGKAASISTLFNDPLNAPAIEREVRGKRTFRVGLVAMPESWLAKLSKVDPEGPEPEPEEPEVELVEPVEEVEPVSVGQIVEHSVSDSVEPEPPMGRRGTAPTTWGEMADALAVETPEPVPTYEPPPELQVAGAVAMELLTRVIEIVTTGGADETAIRLRNERDDARRRLHEQTDLAERRRRQLADVGDELRSVKQERDGLRQRLKLAEANAQKLMSNTSQTAIMELARQQLDKTIRQVPVGPNSKGAD